MNLGQLLQGIIRLLLGGLLDLVLAAAWLGFTIAINVWVGDAGLGDMTIPAFIGVNIIALVVLLVVIRVLMTLRAER